MKAQRTQNGSSAVRSSHFAKLLGATLAIWVSAFVFVSPADAAAPAWSISSIESPENYAPGSAALLELFATNVGNQATGGAPIVFEAELPAGLEFGSAYLQDNSHIHGELPICSYSGRNAVCETTHEIPPGRYLQMESKIIVDKNASEGVGGILVTVSGGNSEVVSSERPVHIQAQPVPFSFVAGLSAPLTDRESGTTTLAGAHPYQQTLDFGFPIEESQNEDGKGIKANSGHPREVIVDLPRGMAVNPSATPVRCREREFPQCPDASQLGVFTLGTYIGFNASFDSPLYNMVPPPGYPAEFAFNVQQNTNIYIHILGGVRSEGDFGLQASVRDIPALGNDPIFNNYTQLWGDPSADIHSQVRGKCVNGFDAEGFFLPGFPEGCPKVSHQKAPLITTPTDCSGQPPVTEVHADSWEEPSKFISASYQNSDLQGEPLSLSGCNQIAYEPTLDARPTTSVADSPSGLDVTVHQPQEEPGEEPLAGRATGELKDATVTLPPGLVANPAQADGRAGCSLSEIGFLSEDPEPGIHFSKTPDSCPDTAKLGTVEVSTPLLAQYEHEGTERVDDPETGAPIPRPLHGAVYLAKPFDNPFGSLLAIYLSINDPRSGTIAKIAGRVQPDPQTGQLTTVFEENPELPLEDIRLHLFSGARASLVTPPACATYTTNATLTPWSAPETADAHPSSSFQISSSPDGGSCPDSAGAAPKTLSFTAGTESPAAGAFSPFSLKLSRPDGSQRLAGFDLTLPPGLSGRLAGVATCSDQAIAAAEARSGVKEGARELANPSCPADSRLGTVTVAAGPGPSPLHVSGSAYLAGPYKGAPLSMAVITPAVAGPFDLGVVVVRAALYVEPETARIHAVSDPFPQILDGIPLDLRSVSVNLDRPSFTINPTSCNTLGFTGTAETAFGQAVPLAERFQAGGCQALPFKPALSLALKGSIKRSSTPRLVATLKAKPGEANIARAQVKLPHAVFLDQAHIRTICTRVQFTADTCPAGSVYGKAEATTPLLGYPLTGSVYLRSNPAHLLPDLVAKLKGPASQPIEVDLVGKTDAVKGALRNTFEAVPDAPVSRFRLELFGGKRGLVEMSGGFCAGRKASVQLDGQNGKVHDTRPVVKAKCPKPRHRHRGDGRGGPRSK